MADDFHKPTKYAGDWFDGVEADEDPAAILRVAHDTAHALIDRARETDDPAVLEHGGLWQYWLLRRACGH